MDRPRPTPGFKTFKLLEPSDHGPAATESVIVKKDMVTHIIHKPPGVVIYTMGTGSPIYVKAEWSDIEFWLSDTTQS